jgi:hypothetical protein
MADPKNQADNPDRPRTEQERKEEGGRPRKPDEKETGKATGPGSEGTQG